jgi:hypothetical protein
LVALGISNPSVDKLKSKLFKVSLGYGAQDLYWYRTLMWCSAIDRKWDWHDSVVDRVNSIIDEALQSEVKGEKPLNYFERFERKIMEIMQVLCAMKLDSPELWAKMDKNRVRIFADAAKRGELGTQAFNDRQHVVYAQPSSHSVMNVPKGRHHFTFAFENQVVDFLVPQL